VVWEKISEVLQNPQLILEEYRRQIQGQKNELGDGGSLDREMAELRRRLKKYYREEKRLVSLFRFGEIKEDNILDELNHLKKERQSDQEQLSQLGQAKERLANLMNAEIKLDQFCERVRQNLLQCSTNERRLALDALGVKIIAGQDRIDIHGMMPIEAKSTPTSSDVTTIGRTSGCLIQLYYEYPSGETSVSILPQKCTSVQ
jgi:site-specific DNA recombinase